MATRRSRRNAAAAAESRIQKVVDDDSEDSQGSDFNAKSRDSSSSSDGGDISSGNASDQDYAQPSSRYNQKNSRNSKTKTSAAPKVPSPPPAFANAPDPSHKELTNDSLKSLMRSFRLTDLQALMIFVGKNKAGRKTEILVSFHSGFWVLKAEI